MDLEASDIPARAMTPTRLVVSFACFEPARKLLPVKVVLEKEILEDQFLRDGSPPSRHETERLLYFVVHGKSLQERDIAVRDI